MNRAKTLLRAYIYISILLLGACSSPEGPRSIPEFSMVLPDTTQVFHSKDIPYGKTAMIIWFDPNCRDCQEETEYILANMQKFTSCNIYMITRHPYDELMVFYNHLKLDTCKNVKVGIDKDGVIPKEFKIRSTPITLIFDKDKRLRALFNGKAPPEKLIETIKQ